MEKYAAGSICRLVLPALLTLCLVTGSGCAYFKPTPDRAADLRGTPWGGGAAQPPDYPLADLIADGMRAAVGQ